MLYYPKHLSILISMMQNIIVVLFNKFETLDVFGPVEIFGSFKEHFKLEYYSLEGGSIYSSQNVCINTKKLSDANSKDSILFVPGVLVQEN